MSTMYLFTVSKTTRSLSIPCLLIYHNHPFIYDFFNCVLFVYTTPIKFGSHDPKTLLKAKGTEVLITLSDQLFLKVLISYF